MKKVLGYILGLAIVIALGYFFGLFVIESTKTKEVNPLVTSQITNKYQRIVTNGYAYTLQSGCVFTSSKDLKIGQEITILKQDCIHNI